VVIFLLEGLFEADPVFGFFVERVERVFLRVAI
jgi:hypothetical protein